MEKSENKSQDLLRRKDEDEEPTLSNEILNNGIAGVITKNPGLVLTKDISKAFYEMISQCYNLFLSDYSVDSALIIGPTGTAKTLTAYQIAYALNLSRENDEKINNEKKHVPLILAQCNRSEDFYALFGHDLLISSKDESGKNETIFVEGPLVQAVKLANKEGFAILLLDEINALLPANQKLLNPLLDGRDAIAYENRKFKLEKGAKLFVIGTMNNTTDGYYGINPLNDDLKRRFGAKFIFPYPEEDDEINIVKDKTGSKAEELIKRLVQLARHTRGNSKEWEGAPLTTANLIAFIKTYEANKQYGDKATALRDAFESTILNNYYEEGEAELRRSLEEKASDLLLIDDN